MKKQINLILTVLIPIIIWMIPTHAIPIEGLSLMEHRVMAIFSFAVLSWILEPIPIFATSVLIIVLEIFTLSNGGLVPFKKSVSEITFSQAQETTISLIAKESSISTEKAEAQFKAYLLAKKEDAKTQLVASLEEANAIDIKEEGTYALIEQEKAYAKVAKAHKKNNAGLIPYTSIMNNFAHRIIMLFLGGFFLAAAATKYRLDTNLARILVKPFGTKPAYVTLGIMLITAVFSMFMSNTACTAMMLAVVAPILKTRKNTDKGRIAMALAVPFAANIGGMGTPIGTPPNAVAMKYLVDKYAISFDQWMLFAVPLVVVLLTIVWVLLTTLYKADVEHIKLEIKGKFLKTPQAFVVYVIFAGTILLWMTGKLHGIPSTVVALIPVAVFVATGVITAKDLKTLSWDVLWLISGGFALGGAMEQTGLSSTLVNAIPFASMSPMLIIVIASVVTMLMATFMSNTATANLLLPIMASLGMALGTALYAVGGFQGLVVGVTLSASLGMALPISTPPNAMAHATGMIDIKAMAKCGAIMSIIGIIAILATVMIMKSLGFFVL